MLPLSPLYPGGGVHQEAPLVNGAPSSWVLLALWTQAGRELFSVISFYAVISASLSGAIMI